MTWKAKLKDNQVVSELTHDWADIKDQVCELLLITSDNRIITLPTNMEKYIQFKSASSDMGTNKIQIESRVIGWQVGNTIVKVRVNEKTHNISIETQ